MDQLKTGFDLILEGLDNIKKGSDKLDVPKEVLDDINKLLINTTTLVTDAQAALETHFKTTLDKIDKIGESDIDTVVDKLLG